MVWDELINFIVLKSLCLILLKLMKFFKEMFLVTPYVLNLSEQTRINNSNQFQAFIDFAKKSKSAANLPKIYTFTSINFNIFYDKRNLIHFMGKRFSTRHHRLNHELRQFTINIFLFFRSIQWKFIHIVYQAIKYLNFDPCQWNYVQPYWIHNLLR